MMFCIEIHNHRHLTKVTIEDIREINVFIGANNSGKTSIFRALEALLLHDHTALSPTSSSYFILETTGARPFEPFASIRRKLTGIRMTGPYEVLRKEQSTWTTPPQQVDASLKRQSTEIDSLIAEFRRSFFVWHRRKSEYWRGIQTTESLSPEAENLAARVDHILATAPEVLRLSLTAFANDVIPGLGELRTVRNSENRVQVAFGTSGAPIPLEDLGGGVEQTLAIAVILLAEDNKRPIFIEEPETHLHPRSQRALARQIREHRGERRVFITTHSPIFMNELSPNARIYRVGPTETHKFSATPCITERRQREILDEIGALPSDLLQTNCAIWVEGPTESIVLRHLLDITTPYREHVDYEFIYSGGALAKFLDGDVHRAAEFRDIFKICRHNFVLFDRDCSRETLPPPGYKTRLQESVGENHHFTAAYEFEWYYPRSLLESIFAAGVADRLLSQADAFDISFYKAVGAAGGPTTGADRKTDYARKIASCSRSNHENDPDAAKASWLDHGAGDLRQLLDKLSTAIGRANHG